MALYLIVVQAHFVMNNIFEGLIWFFLPAALVIVNDIFAYICGIMFGRTQLIKLSPKKTVEGFVGAWICTVIAAYALTALLIRSRYFICPVNVSITSLNLVIVTNKGYTGSRRQHLHWPSLHPQSSLHAASVPFPRLSYRLSRPCRLPPPLHRSHRSHSLPHASLRNLRLTYCAFWRLLRLWAQTNFQG